MIKKDKAILLSLINLIILILFLSIGGYIIVSIKEYEIIGGIILGLTGIIIGIIIPYHLRRIKYFTYSFLPKKDNIIKITLLTICYIIIFLFIYPFILSLINIKGVLGIEAYYKLLKNLPDLKSIIITFLFLLLSAFIYSLLFWGNILHSLKEKYGSVMSILITGLLFSIYHLSEFAFTPISMEFLLLMFISGCLCGVFTIYSGCILPTLIVQQFGQFFYFISLDNNPFSGEMGVIFNLLLFIICFTVYKLVWRKNKINHILNR